ncbi:MAG: amidohydrolase family protein [Myxococcota bacterium]|nr:amidohydrolase family protein [Myxococcota bacterium]MDW8363504.1 amidohydrolase family protein [Myxococcales bacterium]
MLSTAPPVPNGGLHLRGGRLLDPATGTDAVLDVVVSADGRIARIGRDLLTPAGAQPLDVSDQWVVPAAVDLRAHLAEPDDDDERLAHARWALLRAGIGTVCASPATSPPIDTPALARLLPLRARSSGPGPRVLPLGALTHGMAGERLTEAGRMRRAGVVALTDAPRPSMPADLMRRALEHARGFDVLVMQHAEEATLSRRLALHEGPAVLAAGLAGQPSAAESAIVARDLELVALTGSRYHVAHVSSGATLRLLRDARARNLPVSGDVTPLHLLLDETDAVSADPSLRLRPPLRERADREALREALIDGTLQAIASDHHPSTPPLPPDAEPSAYVPGLPVAHLVWPVLLELVTEHGLSPLAAVDRWTWGPARLLGLLELGRLREGGRADLAVIDPDAEWNDETDALPTPLARRRWRGRVRWMLVDGRLIAPDEETGTGTP